MRLRALVRRLQARLFVLPLLALPLLALGCSGSEHSPTEPLDTPKAASAAAVATAQGQSAPAARGEDGELRPGAARLNAARSGQEARPETPNVATAARGGNGNGGGKPPGGGGNGGNGGGNGGSGGGNGGGGNGGGNAGGGRGGELTFEIRPDVWNTNWVHAAGNVQGFVRGKDVAKIDTASVELVAEGASLAPISVRVAGGQLVATFDKSEAFELLGDVKRGDRKTVTLKFKVADEQKELDDQVRIVGAAGDDDDDDGESGELALNIQPDDWNLNWAHSAGQVVAFLRGPGYKDVDIATVRLVGDKTGAEPLVPVDVRRVGKQVVARFAKSAAFKILDDPDAGETHTVKITFSQGDEKKELSEDVRIVGRQ